GVTDPEVPPPARLPGRRAAGRRVRRVDREPEEPAAQVVLRRARQHPVRADHPAGGVLPHPRRAGDPRRPRRGGRRAHRRGHAGRAGVRLGGQDPAADRGAAGRRHAADVRADGRQPLRVAGVRPAAGPGPPGAGGQRGDGRLRAPAGSAAGRGAAAHRVPRRHRRQPGAGAAGGVPGRPARVHRAGRLAAAGHRPGQGPGGAGAGVRRPEGHHRPVQQERARRGEPRAAGGLRPGRVRARRAVGPGGRVDRDAAALDPGPEGAGGRAGPGRAVLGRGGDADRGVGEVPPGRHPGRAGRRRVRGARVVDRRGRPVPGDAVRGTV
ncbi:MAG: L-histidine N(alpha)-methyltransferase, partial [uncultured Corynebacteriales bacterium]